MKALDDIAVMFFTINAAVGRPYRLAAWLIALLR